MTSSQSKKFEKAIEVLTNAMIIKTGEASELSKVISLLRELKNDILGNEPLPPEFEDDGKEKE